MRSAGVVGAFRRVNPPGAARHPPRLRGESINSAVGLSFHDLQIAAIALANGCTLVTHNTLGMNTLQAPHLN